MDSETIQKRRWVILSVLVICLTVVILDTTIMNVALKTIQEDLGASQSSMQWAVDAYALIFAGLLITWGVLGDRLGRRLVLMIGMAAFGVTSALCSFASSPATLILFRALMGIGAAAVQPQTLSIIQNVFEPRERAKAIGIWAGASGAAIALGPIAGGLLLKYFWWGSVFLVNVPVVIIGLVAIAFLVPESKTPHAQRLDVPGVLLSIVALVVLVYGIIEGGDSNEWLRWNTLGAILAGLALLTLFVYLQKRSTHPTIDVMLFKNRAFSSGSVAIALTFFALQGSSFYLAYFMQAVRGYTALSAGLALVAVAGAIMIMAPQAARLSRRFGPRIVAGTGLVLFGLSMLSYHFSTRTMPQWVIEVQLAGMGVGMGLTMTPATNAIMSAVPREKAGAGSAVNNTVRQVAGALGVAILGSLLAVSFRSHLGPDAPAQLAGRLDQPAAVVSTLPPRAQVTPSVRKDASESIGGALEFVEDAGKALKARAALPGASDPAQVAQQTAAAQQAIGGFVDKADDSFVSAMRIVSVVSGGFGLLGAVVAFTFLPGRRENEAGNAPAESDEPVLAH